MAVLLSNNTDKESPSTHAPPNLIWGTESIFLWGGIRSHSTAMNQRQREPSNSCVQNNLKHSRELPETRETACVCVCVCVHLWVCMDASSVCVCVFSCVHRGPLKGVVKEKWKSYVMPLPRLQQSNKPRVCKACCCIMRTSSHQAPMGSLMVPVNHWIHRPASYTLTDSQHEMKIDQRTVSLSMVSMVILFTCWTSKTFHSFFFILLFSVSSFIYCAVVNILHAPLPVPQC